MSRRPLRVRGARARLLAAWPARLLVTLAAAGCGGGGGGGGSSPAGGSSEPPIEPGSSSAQVVPASGVWVDTTDGLDPDELHTTYTIQNTGDEPLSWRVQFSQTWLAASGAASGALGAGASVDVGIDIDALDAVPTGPGPALGLISVVDDASGDPFAYRVVSVDAGSGGVSGWTTFTPSADTLTVYVSSATGNDASDGLTPATARRTIAAGKALLRHGHPDWLLLRRGDTWNEGLGQWMRSGRSQTEPMLVSTYGSATARPLLRTGTQTGFRTEGGGGSPPSIDHVAVVGLHFLANGYAGNGAQPGINLLLPGQDVLFEDCMVQGYGTNVVFQGYGGRHADIRLRRSVIVDAWAYHGQGAHPQGLYAYTVDGLLIEENVFDHNGWKEGVPGAGADVFSHNLYIDNDNTGVVVRGNIVANGSSHGMQLRPGGVAVDNLFVRNSIALSVGGGNNPEPGGVTAQVHDNVILEGKDIDASNPRGWALWFGNIASGWVTGNVIAHNALGTLPRALFVKGDCSGDTAPCIGVHDLALEDNVVYDWGGNLLVEGSGALVTNLSFVGNDVQDLSHPDPLVEHADASTVAGVHSSANDFFSQAQPTSVWTVIGASFQPLATWMGAVGDVGSTDQQVSYVDPERSLAGYNALVGGAASLAAFLASARAQSAADWRPEHTAAQANAYIRAGFVVVGP